MNFKSKGKKKKVDGPSSAINRVLNSRRGDITRIFNRRSISVGYIEILILIRVNNLEKI